MLVAYTQFGPKLSRVHLCTDGRVAPIVDLTVKLLDRNMTYILCQAPSADGQFISRLAYFVECQRFSQIVVAYLEGCHRIM